MSRKISSINHYVKDINEKVDHFVVDNSNHQNEEEGSGQEEV